MKSDIFIIKKKKVKKGKKLTLDRQFDRIRVLYSYEIGFDENDVVWKILVVLLVVVVVVEALTF